MQRSRHSKTAGFVTVLAMTVMPLAISWIAPRAAGAQPARTAKGVATSPVDASRYRNCADPAMGVPFATARPDEVGLDARTLRQAADWYTQHLQLSMRVYRFGCLVQTTALDDAGDRIPQNMYSVAKTVTTLVLGRAVALGYDIGVDDPLSKFFPEFDAAHGRITIRQLLNHTSGLKVVWTNEVNTTRADSVKSFAALPVEHEPGTFFAYAQIPCTVVAAAVERAVGRPFRQFAEDALFDRIGIAPGTWMWKTDRAGWTEGFSELYLRPRDFARLGHLALHDGRWNGEQLIPKPFFDQMTTGTAQNAAFGFNTWSNSASWYYTPAINSRTRVEHAPIQSAPADMHFSWGWRGRLVFVMPNLQMVVTTAPIALQAPLPGQVVDGYNGHDADVDEIDAHQVAQSELRRGYHELFRILMRAVTDQSIEDPGPWTDQPDDSFDPGLWVDPELVAENPRATDPQTAGFCSWCATMPGVYARSLTSR